MAWPCPKCTFLNEHGGQKCEACDAYPLDDVLLDIGLAQSKTVWTCSTCTYQNEHNGLKCEACHGDQPHSDPPSDKLQQLHLEAVSSPDPFSEDSIQSEGAGISRKGNPTNSFGGQKTLTEEGVSQLGTASVSGFQASSSNDGATNSPDTEIRMVLLGRTGSGKSATGNTILDDSAFTSTISSTSVTKGCQRGTRTRFGRYLQVIDTPGMYDTEMSNQCITTEVIKCVAMVAPGPHAFLLVLTLDRHTEEVQNTIDHFAKIFGEGMHNFVIVVFSKRDDLSHHGTTVEEYLENGSGNLKDLLKACNYRYVTFNNRGTPDEKEKDVKRLLGVIIQMVQKNGGVYTNEMFQEAEKIMKDREKKLKQEHEENVERQRSQIEERYKRELRTKEKSYEAITCQLLQVLKNREQSGMSSQGAIDVQRQLEGLSEEIKRLKETIAAEIESLRNQNVNHREDARKEVNNGAKEFVMHTLVPGIIELTKAIVPALLQFFK